MAGAIEPVSNALAVSFGDRTPPPTARGRQTRDLLLAAARVVFERTSFMEARVADIAQEAKVSHGSFYTYFDSKEHVFWEIIESVTEAMYQRPPPPPRGTAAHERGTYEYHVWRIDRGTRNLIETYRANAEMIRAFEEVATYNDTFRQTRRKVRLLFIERAERGIRAVQAAGFANPNIDPYYAAHALASMVDRFAYSWFVLGEPFDFETAVSTLSTLWRNGIEMSPDRWR